MFELEPIIHIHRWRGRPSHQAAHNATLSWLKTIPLNFLDAPAPNPLDTRTKGNLGESITAFLGLERSHVGHRCDGPNFLTPLSGISRSEIDLVWLEFNDTDGLDFVWLQEVKTSSDSDLAVARKLTDDYQKLFGTDLERTLATRLQAIAAQIQYRERQPDLAARIRSLCEIRPQDVQQVYLEPTLLVDDTLIDLAETRLIGVSAAIAGFGWPNGQIKTHLISLDDLESRLSRLASGQQ